MLCVVLRKFHGGIGRLRVGTMKIQFIILILIFHSVEECRGGPNEERLIDDIFNARKYSPYARPVAKETDALEVSFGISLQQIIDVDEKNEMLNTNLWLNYVWKDYKLSWNESEYGGLPSIRLPSKLIWTPDILLYNSVDEDIDSKFPTNIVVYSDGTCNWVPLGLYISSCAINIKWFPFDDQVCIMKFGSWSYDGGSINLTARSDVIDISTYQPSGEWDLIAYPAVRNVVTYDCCVEPYIDITFTIHIRRRTLYYGFNLIIPCALISLLALVTFMQPPDAGEKIGLGITILLSLSVFQLIVADMVPATSLAVPLVGVYFAAVMIMCTVSVIMTVIVLNFHHRKPDMYEMPKWVRRVICEWLSWVLRMSRPGKKLSREQLRRNARMRDLEAKTHPSLSLMSNVNGANNVFLPFSPAYPPSNGHSSDTYNNGRQGADRMSCVSRGELLAILTELRFITQKLREDNDSTAETNDWKFAAMVLDRLCFWVCSVYFVVGTLAIFLSPPNITSF